MVYYEAVEFHLEFKLDFKKFLPYLGALVVLIGAIVGIVHALQAPKNSPEYWDGLSSSVTQVKAAADQATATSVTDKDYGVCVSTSVTSAIAGGVAESLAAVKMGTCHIPDVTVDVSQCLPLKAAPPTAAVATDAGTSDATPTVSVDSGAVVDAALGPVIGIVQGVVDGSNASPTAKAWSHGVISWLQSGKTSLVALVEDPKEGKLAFKGVDIEGCTP